MVLVFCMSFCGALRLYEISQTVFNLQSGHEYMVEMTLLNVQRAITPKVGNLDFRFMCSARRLIVLYTCV